jgi:hypothetical protein
MRLRRRQHQGPHGPRGGRSGVAGELSCYPVGMLECPKCGSTGEKIEVVFLVETRCPLQGESPGTLTVGEGVDDEPEDGAHPRLRCKDCGARWALPHGVSVVSTARGKRTRIFGP